MEVANKSLSKQNDNNASVLQLNESEPPGPGLFNGKIRP